MSKPKSVPRIWLQLAVTINVLLWGSCSYVAVQFRPDWRAGLAAVAHLVFVAPQVVVAIRAWCDRAYAGYRLGLLRFEGRPATLPGALVLVWGAASALLLASVGRGPALWVPLLGDLFFVLMQGIPLVRARRTISLQGGEYFRLQGWLALALIVTGMVGPLGYAAAYCALHIRP